jgi:Spy/CpxP family protein refolding chaperone
MKKSLVVLFVFVAAGLLAQGMMHPPMGKWWKNEKVAADLGLTPDQQARLDQIMFTQRDKMIDLKAQLEKAELRLRDAMDKPALNEKEIMDQLDRTIAARGTMQKNRVEMIVKIRGVLTPEQWAKAKAKLHEHMRSFREKGREYGRFQGERRMGGPNSPAMGCPGAAGARHPGGPGMAKGEGPGMAQPGGAGEQHFDVRGMSDFDEPGMDLPDPDGFDGPDFDGPPFLEE